MIQNWRRSSRAEDVGPRILEVSALCVFVGDARYVAKGKGDRRWSVRCRLIVVCLSVVVTDKQMFSGQAKPDCISRGSERRGRLYMSEDYRCFSAMRMISVVAVVVQYWLVDGMFVEHSAQGADHRRLHFEIVGIVEVLEMARICHSDYS